MAIELTVNEKETGATRDQLDKLIALIRKTEIEKPKREDVSALRRLLETTPDLWRVLGDLARVSMHTRVSDGWLNEAMRVSVTVGVEEIRKDLGYRDSPALEKMLIDQAVICWLQAQKTQLKYEHNLSASIGIPQADYWERRLTAANARYLRACEALARVRKLSRPGAVQVNIGAQQVNVAQTKETPPKIGAGE